MVEPAQAGAALGCLRVGLRKDSSAHHKAVVILQQQSACHVTTVVKSAQVLSAVGSFCSFCRGYIAKATAVYILAIIVVYSFPVWSY